MKPVTYDDIIELVRQELNIRMGKQQELEEYNKKIKLLSHVLEYKGKVEASRFLKKDKLPCLKRLFYPKTEIKGKDIQQLSIDISHFSNRIKNLTDHQRTIFYETIFGKISKKVQINFIRDITEYKKLSMKKNPTTLDFVQLTKYFINLTTSLSMMFEVYSKYQAKRQKLQEELSVFPKIIDLKRILRKLEKLDTYYLTEKDKKVLLSLVNGKKKAKTLLETFIKTHNENWKLEQEKKKETLQKIKSLEVKNRSIRSDNIVLVKESKIDTDVLVETSLEKENAYVTSLLELLRVEPKLENLTSFLPTIEFQDYYLIRDELLEKVEEEYHLLHQAKRNIKEEEELDYITEEIDKIKSIYDYLCQYFKMYEKEEKKELEKHNEEISNKLIFLVNSNGIPYFIKDIKNDLEREQIPYLLKAMKRMKQGVLDFDTRKLNKFKSGKGYLGADDVFEAKAGQVRILFQYLGEHKIGVLMYFNKKSNRTTLRLHEMMRERITNCQAQVEWLRGEIETGTLEYSIFTNARKEEQNLIYYLLEQDKSLKKKYYQNHKHF